MSNTIKTSKIQIVDNEGDVAKEIYLSNGNVTIDGAAIDTGGVSPTEIDLNNGLILVGDATNKAAGVAMSGQATVSNTGAVTVANSAVIAKVLTGYVSGAGTVAATDTLLQSVNKLNGNQVASRPSMQSYTLVGNATISQAYSDVAGGGMAQVASVQVSVTLTQTSIIDIKYTGAATLPTAELVVGYQIDALTAVPCIYMAPGALTQSVTVPLNKSISLAAGTYVIKLMASRVTNNVTLLGPTNFNAAIFEVVVH